jgi:hypothetical protein
MTEFGDFIDFPLPTGGFVYVFHFGETPFYVGGTDCFLARMCEYHRKNFASPTDFNIGEAAIYFRGKGYSVTVKYRQAQNYFSEEAETIAQLRREGYRLLNGELGYRYDGPSDTRLIRIDQQRKRIQEFCDPLLTERQKRIIPVRHTSAG